MKLLIRFLLAALVLAVLPTTDVLAQANRITGPTGSTPKPPKKKPPKKKPTQPTTPAVNTSPRADEVITVKDVSFKMLRVEGGTFTIGATSEQGSDAQENEKPAHQVTLSTFSLARQR